MRHLARQRLPARHARYVDQPLARVLQLIRHVIERRHRRANFIQPARSQPTSAQPVQAAGRPAQERANVIDDDENTEGIRIVPGRDN